MKISFDSITNFIEKRRQWNLGKAIARGDTGAVSKMLDQVGNIDDLIWAPLPEGGLKHKFRSTPMQTAANWNQPEVAALLIARGARIDGATMDTAIGGIRSKGQDGMEFMFRLLRAGCTFPGNLGDGTSCLPQVVERRHDVINKNIRKIHPDIVNGWSWIQTEALLQSLEQNTAEATAVIKPTVPRL